MIMMMMAAMFFTAAERRVLRMVVSCEFSIGETRRELSVLFAASPEFCTCVKTTPSKRSPIRTFTTLEFRDTR